MGAFVGGGATLLGSLLTGRQSSQSAKEAHDDLVAATALLMQDDLYHFQVSIARGIDRCGWWADAEVLAQQSTVEDRKTVWAALPDKPLDAETAGECLPYITDMPGDLRSRAPISLTNVVADAQGWMDYLRQRRDAKTKRHEAPTASDLAIMKRTFALLDVARRSLQEIARRPATDFSASRIFSDLGPDCQTVRTLLAHDCREES